MANTVLIFLASISGIMVYFTSVSSEAFVFCLFAVTVAGLVTLAGYQMVATNPVTATYLLAAWRAFPLALVLFAGYLSAWLSLNILDHVPFEFVTDVKGTPEEVAAALKAQKSTASSLIIAAINTFLGAMIIDASKNPESALWPTTLHRKALKAAFDGKTTRDTSTWKKEARHALEDIRYAYGEDATADNAVRGWSFSDRVKRAKIIRGAQSVLIANGIKIL